ncbi:MAG: thioredoxin domain-containing protein, partial [Bacteroidota bacterium]
MNRLQYSTSPYLLQHASNPVDWYPWGPEALERAQREDKPIIVSIGYSTCHWCHVMERESFEDETVAAFMNEHFICIKVDREERPDVDRVYMEACQAISGGGGWPLNAILLPDTKPIYAGTYFPPKPLHNRPSWLELLKYLHKIYTEQRERVVKEANKLTDSMAQSAMMFIKPPAEGAGLLAEEAIENMLINLRGRFDMHNGGFGGAPKFPMSQSLELLLDHSLLTDHPHSVQLAELGMQAMINGGIYDQLGGGFSRYTVDAGWRVPHFEKMLYDNALLLRLLGKLQMYRPSGEYRAVIEESIEWLRREMTSPSGSFYAALDADSEGVEGKFYTWNQEEIAAVFTDEIADKVYESLANEIEQETSQVQTPTHSTASIDFLTTYMGYTPEGNWEEERTNIFYRKAPFPAEQQVTWESIRSRLLAARDQRIRPGRDEKIILQWNALMISGLAYCYRATQNVQYLSLAEDALAALRKELYIDGQWHRNYKDGQVGEAAYLDDYTALIEATLDLYQANFDHALLLEAKELIQVVTQQFGGAPGELYYLRPTEGSELPIATLDLYDNSLPSGNSQLLHQMLRIGQLLGEHEWSQMAREKIQSVLPSVNKYPSSFANWGRLALYLSRP